MFPRERTDSVQVFLDPMPYSRIDIGRTRIIQSCADEWNNAASMVVTEGPVWVLAFPCPRLNSVLLDVRIFYSVPEAYKY